MSNSIQSFWTKNKVFFIGLLSSLAVVLQELLSKPQSEQSMKVFLFAGIMTVLSFISKEWRGKGVTLLGIVGTLAGVFVSLNQTGTFTWNQFILYSIAAILSAVAPPAKPSTYEHDATIVKAKTEPPVDYVRNIDDIRKP